MREVERCLDANLFLDEYLRWEAGRLHHPYVVQCMFAHTEAAGWKEHDCTICRGCQQPLPKWDATVEAPAIKVVGYKTTREGIIALYHEVYQLRRGPRAVPCDPEMEEEIHPEILESLKECLWHRWGSALLEEEPR